MSSRSLRIIVSPLEKCNYWNIETTVSAGQSEIVWVGLYDKTSMVTAAVSNNDVEMKMSAAESNLYSYWNNWYIVVSR